MGPYGMADMAKVMYGENARHIPAWMYVQEQGPGVVGLIGASRTAEGTPHPLLYGTNRTHVFVVGEIIVRPHIAIATDALTGMGAGGLYLGSHEFGDMLGDGELIVGSDATLNRIRSQWEG